jgi:Na+/phosphate symporter
MFKKFKEMFASENLLDTAYQTTVKMLEYDFEMYDASRHALRETGSNQLPFDIKKMDRKINKYEREVRRQVLTHLAIRGAQDLAPGLGLVSIVIDVERIGDYTKNISDLAAHYREKLHGGKFEDDLVKIEAVIEKSFPDTIEAMKTQDVESARAVMRGETGTGKLADETVYAMIAKADQSIDTGRGVAVAMYARYLKRVNAHLTNIASAIVNPFPRIGFREKKKK